MLNNLYISNFKCFESLELPMRPLTLLTGLNGGGKSSVIQALGLISQTINEQEWGRRLMLEGANLSLGCVADIWNQRALQRDFKLGASTGTERMIWAFNAEERQALSAKLETVEHNEQILDIEGPLRWLLPIDISESSSVVSVLRRLSWITAERIGPRELHPLRDEHQSRVGARGEFAASVFLYGKDDKVRRELLTPDFPPTLFHQIRARMKEYFPGCELRVSRVENANAVNLLFRMSSAGNFQRPQNVGFGLTQLFPILVALLTAKEGDVLLIENPEVHLHPHAQQQIGEFLAKVAASHVQIIVETHSDHVLNGVRLAAKAKNILAEDVAVHFFAPHQDNFAPISPKLDSDGRLDSWPDGFFDQFDRALSQLL